MSDKPTAKRVDTVRWCALQFPCAIAHNTLHCAHVPDGSAQHHQWGDLVVLSISSPLVYTSLNILI